MVRTSKSRTNRRRIRATMTKSLEPRLQRSKDSDRISSSLENVYHDESFQPSYTCMRLMSPHDRITRRMLRESIEAQFEQPADAALFYFSRLGTANNLDGYLVTQGPEDDFRARRLVARNGEACVDRVAAGTGDDERERHDDCINEIFDALPFLLTRLIHEEAVGEVYRCDSNDHIDRDCERTEAGKSADKNEDRSDRFGGDREQP